MAWCMVVVFGESVWWCWGMVVVHGGVGGDGV